MAQHDYNLANAGGSAFRSDLNDALAAILSGNSGSSAPSTTVAYMWWHDTTTGLIKQRNAANSGWVIRGTLAETRVVGKSGAYTVLAADYDVLFKCTGTWSLALTAAATMLDGHRFRVQNVGSGVITIDPNSSEQIDGATTIALYPGQGCEVCCDGAAFYTVGRTSAAVGSSLVLLSTPTISGGVVDVSGFSSTYDKYVLEITDLMVATSAADLQLLVSQSASLRTGAADYRHGRHAFTSGAAAAAAASSGDSKIVLANGLGNTSAYALSGQVEIYNPVGTANFKRINWRVSYISSTPEDVGINGTGTYLGGTSGSANAAWDGVRLKASSGNISSATFALYGVRKA